MGNVGKGLVVLGSTGSIGTQTMDILRAFPDEFRVVGLAARNNLDLLAQQVQEFKPQLVSCQGSQEEVSSILSPGCDVCSMEEMVQHPDVDLVMMATVGEAGLGPTIAALERSKQVALANKEVVVMAGDLVTSLATRKGKELLPVDSEPSAIWQCLNGEGKEVSRLIITASGGAFRGRSISELARVTPQDALKHPTWTMGQKITIDSATLMNKAFEVIESHWLFGVPWDRIEVVVHPQSIIHSMVEFDDGSVKAQLSPPDMRLPIQYSLFYPKRVFNRQIARFNPVEVGTLTFEPLDHELFPCFSLALETGMKGGTWPAVLSAADEVAVELFLTGKISFLEIEQVIREVLKDHSPIVGPSIDQILDASKWARERAGRVVGV